MPTWLEEVHEQSERAKCTVCGEPASIAGVRSRPDLYPPEHEEYLFCSGCNFLLSSGQLRRETGQDSEGNLVVRWRLWHQVWQPGDLLPIPEVQE